jgi:UDP-N-acetylglucosamine 2-epimerase (non-hydrolysing)
MRTKVLTIFGTRPEAIKLVPVIRAFNSDAAIDSRICVTFQHREMLTQVLNLFDINVDEQLEHELADSLIANSLSHSLGRMVDGLGCVMSRLNPNVVVVHGDTSSCLAGALAAFYHQIPVVHIEAGLRTGNLGAPFPEEAHRQMVARIASLHLVPTERARAHLLAENIKAHSIYVTGNTIVDAVAMAVQQIKQQPQGYFEHQLRQQAGMENFNFNRPLVLITLHRRESQGEIFSGLCRAILQLARENPDRAFVFPVHLNPAVSEPAERILRDASNIYLVSPQEYLSFIWLLNRAELVITDSGGVQEEAEVLGKPVLIVRDKSDRAESLGHTQAMLIGTAPSDLITQANYFFRNPKRPFGLQGEDTQALTSVFGDGHAAQRVVELVKRKYLSGFADSKLTVSSCELSCNP